MESLAEKEVVPAKKDGDNNIIFTKEFMAELKAILDDYAAENQLFVLKRTWKPGEIPASIFRTKEMYQFFKDYTSSHNITAFGAGRFSGEKYNRLWIGDVTPIIKDGGGFVATSIYMNNFYTLNGNWEKEMADFTLYRYMDTGDVVSESYSSVSSYVFYNTDETYFSTQWQGYLVTPDGGRMRVFKTQADFMNYSVGQRKIYYTSNYYDYVPEDLSVSIDDLQKAIDDMQDVIDKLLDQIGNDTSESEIEELLKKILEELQKNPGGGSGSGSGGGDVNVDIDLSTTNSLLSKIYAKISEIFNKLQSGGSDGSESGILKKAFDAVLSRLDQLDATLKKYLSEITGDLDDIKSQLEDMSEEEFGEKSGSFLDDGMDLFSEVGEVAKTKFPFSIPNDLHLFISKIAPPPEEGEGEPQPDRAQYSVHTSGTVPYSGEHGGGGSSRPGSGFVDVEHGGGGSSRDPVELENNAPVFYLPIVIERYGIEEYIVIDMSPFDPLSRFSRGFFTILFIACLYNLTFKVIGMWGDLIG